MSEATRQVQDRAEVPGPQRPVSRHDAGPAPELPLVSRDGTAAVPTRRNAPNALLALQRAAGNRAVAGLMGRVTLQRHPAPTVSEEVEEGAAAAGPAAAGAVPTELGTEGAVEEGAGGPAAETQPGTGTTGSTTGGPTGSARRSAIEQVLAASDTGRWAQAIVTRWSIPVDYEYGGQGSFHQGGNIYINRTLGIGAAAITMMHEAQHANTFKTGRGADRESLSRDQYVRQSIADEAEAVVRQIEGLAVTTGLGVDMAGNPITDALKQRYLRAFYARRDQLEASNPGMSRAAINEDCRRTTRDGEVTNWFYDGTFVTSTNNNSYAVFYGNQWDEVHRAPGTR